LWLGIDSIELAREEHNEVLEWGIRHDSTYYDSVYVRSSKKIGGTLLTADDILYEKAHKEVLALHLKDFQK